MNRISPYFPIYFIGISLFLAAPAVSSARIINVNAALSGASIPGEGGLWNHPTGGVTLNVEAGTYTFQVLSPRESPDALYTGWSFQFLPKYYTGYLVFDAADLNALIIDGSRSPTWFNSAQEAYNWAESSGHNITSYTFTQPATLIFAVPDPYVSDNLGGVSINVFATSLSAAQPAPEPATGLLLAMIGAMGLIICRGSRRLLHART